VSSCHARVSAILAQLVALLLLATLLWIPARDAQAAAEPDRAAGSAGTGASAPEAEVLPAPGSEVVELRERQSATYATDKPGVFESKVYSGPVHFKDGERWERIDRTLRPQGSRFGNSGRNDFDLSVGADHRDRELVRFDSKRGHSVAYSMEGARPGAASPDPQGGEQRIVYRSIQPHVDLQLRSLAHSVEEVLARIHRRSWCVDLTILIGGVGWPWRQWACRSRRSAGFSKVLVVGAGSGVQQRSGIA
jgi:hypothetical protein